MLARCRGILCLAETSYSGGNGVEVTSLVLRCFFMKQQEATRYGGVSQLLHWVTGRVGRLCVQQRTGGIGGPRLLTVARFSAASPRDRGIMRARVGHDPFAVEDGRDTTGAGGIRAMHTARTAVEVALYVLLFAVPLTAVFGARLEGHPLTLLGGWSIPVLPIASHDAGVTVSRLHTWLGDAIIWLAVFHALAALYHHVILKDTALISMLPTWLPIRQLSFAKRQRANRNTNSFWVSK